MGKRTGNVPVGSIPKSSDWRKVLNEHAKSVWSETREVAPAKGCAEKSRPTARLEIALGPLASEALAVVEALTLGARQRNAAAATDPLPDEVQSGLDLIIRGLSAKRDEGGLSPVSEESPLVIQRELWQLLRTVRESGELSYSRQFKLINLDRRVLMMLRNAGPTVPADIAGSAGVDKAQVSRSVKRLLEAGLITRSQVRSPLNLTGKGEALAEKLAKISVLRNRELTFEIDDAELGEFFTAMRKVLERAVMLFEKEREIALGNEGSAAVEEPEIHGSTISAPDRTRIIFPVLTLCSYFARSGALAFKRLTGLSNFEVFVLQEIAYNPPIEWNDLVAILQRDHSQAGRTVNALAERGLIRREGKPERRHGRFSPTKEGQKMHRILRKAGRERSIFLLAPLTSEDRERFFATLALIQRNARAQLERERALANMDLC